MPALVLLLHVPSACLLHTPGKAKPDSLGFVMQG
jgi:hypothetical protein